MWTSVGDHKQAAKQSFSISQTIIKKKNLYYLIFMMNTCSCDSSLIYIFFFFNFLFQSARDESRTPTTRVRINLESRSLFDLPMQLNCECIGDSSSILCIYRWYISRHFFIKIYSRSNQHLIIPIQLFKIATWWFCMGSQGGFDWLVLSL